MYDDGYFSMPISLLKQPGFNKWLTSSEARLWLILSTKIVRGECNSWLPKYVYQHFYKKGVLATSWRLSALAKEMGYSDGCEGNVSKLLGKLVAKKYIKKHVVVVKNQKTNVYELGYIEKTKNVEILHTYSKFMESTETANLDSFYEKREDSENSDLHNKGCKIYPTRITKSLESLE